MCGIPNRPWLALEDRLVRTSLLLLTPGRVGISQVDKKGQKKKEGRKKRQNTDLRLHNIRRRGPWRFWYFACVYVWLSRELSENPKHQPRMLSHLWSSPFFSLAASLSWLRHSLAPCLRLNLQLVSSARYLRLSSPLGSRSLIGLHLHWPHAAFWLLKTLIRSSLRPRLSDSSSPCLKLDWPTSLVLAAPYFRPQTSTWVHMGTALCVVFALT